MHAHFVLLVSALLHTNQFPPQFKEMKCTLYLILSDGTILATAAGQLRTFDASDNKKIQKFSGHPVSVFCMPSCTVILF